MLKGSDRIVMWKFAWPYLWIYRSFIMFKQYVVISHTLTKLMFKVEFLLFKKYYYNQLKNCLNNCEFLWNFGMSYNSNTHLFKVHQSHTLSKLGFSYILTREKVETNFYGKPLLIYSPVSNFTLFYRKCSTRYGK